MSTCQNIGKYFFSMIASTGCKSIKVWLKYISMTCKFLLKTNLSMSKEEIFNSKCLFVNDADVTISVDAIKSVSVKVIKLIDE